MFRAKIVIDNKWPLSCKIVALAVILVTIWFPLSTYHVHAAAPLVIASLCLAFLAIFTWLLFENGLRQLNRTCRSFLCWWFLISVMMLLLGLVKNPIDVGNFAFDIGHILLFSMGVVFAHRPRWPLLMKLFVICGIIGLAGGVYALFLVGGGSVAAYGHGRAYVWTTPYFLWWLLFFWPVLLFGSLFNEKKYYFLAFGGTALYMILGAFFLKRVIFFEIIVVVLIAAVAWMSTRRSFSTKIKVISKKCIGALFVVALSVGVFSILDVVNPGRLIDLFALTKERIAYQDVREFDRLLELKWLLEESTPLQIIVGSGIGSTHDLLGFTTSAVHIGWGNLIFKGGILLVILFATGALIIFRNLISRRNMGYSKTFTCAAAFFLSGLLISPYWGWTPLAFLFGSCFFSSLNASTKEAIH